MPDEPPWKVENYEAAFGQYPEARPALDRWLAARAIDPQADAWRIKGFPNLYFAAIPGTELGSVVLTCTYRVEFTTGTVWCDMFSYLSPPFAEELDEEPHPWPEDDD